MSPWLLLMRVLYALCGAFAWAAGDTFADGYHHAAGALALVAFAAWLAALAIEDHEYWTDDNPGE